MGLLYLHWIICITAYKNEHIMTGHTEMHTKYKEKKNGYYEEVQHKAYV
jgi:hypothetical protein